MVISGKSLAIMAYSGAQESAVLGLADLLETANLISASQRGVTITVDTLRPDDLAENPTLYDAVILPPNRSGARGAEDRAVHGWIQRQHEAGTRIASVCATMTLSPQAA